MTHRLKSVFISYRRTPEGEPTATALRAALERLGFDAFLDVQVAPGKFKPQIMAEIARREVFILLLTTGDLAQCHDDGDWLRDEFKVASGAGKLIVPVLYRNADITTIRSECPAEMLSLFEHTSYRLDHSTFEENVARIASRLDELQPRIIRGSTDLIAAAVTIGLVVWAALSLGEGRPESLPWGLVGLFLPPLRYTTEGYRVEVATLIACATPAVLFAAVAVQGIVGRLAVDQDANALAGTRSAVHDVGWTMFIVTAAAPLMIRFGRILVTITKRTTKVS